MTDLLTLLEARGYRPRRVSSAYGGEYVSPCPGPCKGEGQDRFHVWPRRENDNGKCLGRYWCRHCDISGDTIQYLMDIDGMDFPAACAELGIATGRGGKSGRVWTGRSRTPVMPVDRGDFWEPREYPPPSSRWWEQAESLLLDCRDRLERDAEAQEWLAARGIPMPLARAYGLGYNRSGRGGDRYRPLADWGLPASEKPDGKRGGRLWLPQGWVIPSFDAQGRVVQLRIRRRNQDLAAFAPDTKYLHVRGGSMATMLLHPEAQVWAVVESGFDAILLAGLFGGRLGVATTWNSSARPDARAHGILSRASLVLGALDYDPAGDAQQSWWRARYPHYRRLPPLPDGAKDPGDAFARGADLYAWIVDALPRPMRIALGVESVRARPCIVHLEVDEAGDMPRVIDEKPVVAANLPQIQAALDRASKQPEQPLGTEPPPDAGVRELVEILEQEQGRLVYERADAHWHIVWSDRRGAANPARGRANLLLYTDAHLDALLRNLRTLLCDRTSHGAFFMPRFTPSALRELFGLATEAAA